MFKGTTNTIETEFNVGPTLQKKVPKFKLPKPKDDIDKAINAFLNGETGKFGKYVAVANALVYRTIISERNGSNLEMAQNVIALKIDRPDETLFIGNSSVLPLIGRSVSFGRERLNSSVSDVQTRLSRYIQMIPFTVFTESGLNLTQIKILERGPEETIVRLEEKYDSKKRETVKFPVEVHFTGASLFTVENKHFLFDIDRREVKHKIFNPFLVQLAQGANSISEAYELLKPQEVKDAEEKGLEVKRQGEWFFIPVKGDFKPVQERNQWGDNKGEMVNQRLELRAGNNRPNHAKMYANVGKEKVVSGLVEHSGREHAGLLLKGWYKAVPNTSIESFTITGDVD